MAEDFKVSLSIEYDDAKLTELQSKITAIGKDNKITLTMDASNVTSQLKSIKQEIQNLSNIKINLGSGSGSGGGGSTGNIAKITKAYTELISVMKKLNNTELKIKGLDSSENGNQIQALESLKQHYEDLKKSLESKLSTSQLDSLTPTIEELKLKLQELDGKLEDTKNNFANEIKLKFDTKEFEQNLTSVTSKYDSLKEKNTEVTTATENFKNAYNQLITAIKSGNTDQIVSSFNNYKTALATVENELKNYTQSTNDAYNAQQTLTKSSTLSNNIQTWMNNNKKAAEEYGDKLRELQSQLQNNTDASVLKNVTNEFNNIKSAASAAGLTVSSFSSSLLQTVKQVTGLTSIVAVIRKIINVVKEAVEIVTDLDDAMTQLQIVTGATDSEMSEFLENSISLAKELGQDISDVLESMTTFSRLGYDLEDSSTLAEYASILSNVADVDLDDATSGLTSVIKGFGIDVDDIEHVADVLVELGNSYAVSASEILEAMENSSAALAATGTSYEKSAALIAAGEQNCLKNIEIYFYRTHLIARKF